MNWPKREEINGANRCPTYLYRWILLATKRLSIYLHKFVGDDWSLDLHDHPKRFISIGLWGSYVEFTPKGSKMYDAPWFRSFPAEHIHRLTLPRRQHCWTLVLTLHATRAWGFWHAFEWIPWKEYVIGKFSHIADSMRSCP